MIPAIIVTLISALLISLLWVRGIDKMKEKYPDYNGEDFLSD